MPAFVIPLTPAVEVTERHREAARDILRVVLGGGRDIIGPDHKSVPKAALALAKLEAERE